MSEREPGRILTFYSYKGGTGRSMVLANVAWILASAGKRVLMIDWDLEAPGLHRYFRPFLIDDRLSATPGLIDFVIRYAIEAKRRGTRTQSDGTVPVSPPESPEVVPEWVRKQANILDYRVAIDWEFPAGGALDLVAAGKQDVTYAARVSTFHWQNFYEHLGGGHLVNAMRDVVRSEYDYVLIDSRTGVSDTAGICTVQLPDELVVCFTYNNQSTEGAAGVARSVYQQRYAEGGDTTFRVHPVPMRVDTNEERRLQKRQRYARKLFDPLLHQMSGERGAYWTAIEVPSIAAFAYEEVLATFSDDPSDPKRLLGALIRVTGLLTGGKVSSFRLLAEPEERDEVLTRFAELEGDEPQERTTVVEDPADAAARRAERAYVALPRDEKKAAALLWMRMVRVTSEEEAADLARVRVSTSELEPKQIPPHVIEAFLNGGVVNRTKSTLGSDEKLEPVDDAFLNRWSRISEWIEEHREFLLWRQQLRLRVAEWEERGRPRVRPNVDDAKAEEWKKAGYDFSPRETAFIEAGDRFDTIMGCIMFIVLAILLAWGGWKLIGVVRGYFGRREQAAFDRQKAVNILTAARASKDPAVAAPPAAEPRREIRINPTRSEVGAATHASDIVSLGSHQSGRAKLNRRAFVGSAFVGSELRFSAKNEALTPCAPSPASGPRRDIEGGEQRIEKRHSFHATRVLEVFRENRGDLASSAGWCAYTRMLVSIRTSAIDRSARHTATPESSRGRPELCGSAWPAIA